MLVRWTQGNDHGLVWEHGLAVLSGSVEPEAARRLWTELAEGGDLAAFLKALSAGTGADLLSLPDFAIALRSAGGGWQLAARGCLQARAGDAAVRGDGISTWAERSVAGPGAVSVGAGEASGEQRPIVAGLVPAAVLDWDGSAQTPVARIGRVAEPRPLDVRAAVNPTTPADPPAPSAAEPLDAAAQEQEPEGEAEQPAPGGESGLPADQPTMAPEAAPEQPIEPDADSDDRHSPASPDALVEQDAAASSAPAVADAGWFAPPVGEGRFARQFAETAPVYLDAPGSELADAGLIVSVPKAAAMVVEEDEGDHDGHTMMATLADLGELADPVNEMAPPDAGDGPLVLSMVCANGHANPPQRATCTVCGAELSGEPVRVPRPSLGIVRMPNGDRLELNAPVIVGRNPRADRMNGSAQPHLVPLSQGHVSGMHLELRLEDWNVLAVDLHSTNGTFLRRQGEAPVRLGERPELLVTGDVLDLGHGVQLVVEQLR